MKDGALETNQIIANSEKLLRQAYHNLELAMIAQMQKQGKSVTEHEVSRFFAGEIDTDLQKWGTSITQLQMIARADGRLVL